MYLYIGTYPHEYSVSTRSRRGRYVLYERFMADFVRDADVVLFVYREEYYLARKEPRPNTQEHFDWQEQMNRVNGVAEVIIGKQRHGPTGIVELQFEASLTKFQNLVRADYLPERFE